jgi:hypothetical protein
MPTSSAPPNYYSDSPGSSQKIFVRSTPEIRTDSFRFPETSDQNSFHLSHHSSDHRSTSAESDVSPGYETDAGSGEMSSYPIPSKSPAFRSTLPPPDNMWDHELGPALSLRRRHSDSFFHSQHWKFSAYATAWSREDGRGHPSASSLHPCVSVCLPHEVLEVY